MCAACRDMLSANHVAPPAQRLIRVQGVAIERVRQVQRRVQRTQLLLRTLMTVTDNDMLSVAIADAAAPRPSNVPIAWTAFYPDDGEL